jgi:hypothetical protein
MGSALGRDMDVINQARVKLFMDVGKLNRLYPLATAGEITSQGQGRTPAGKDRLSQANGNPRFRL